MGRKLYRAERCVECKMKDAFCICELLSPILNKNFVTILMHQRELLTTTNTARIAHKMLKNSEIHIRGKLNSPLEEDSFFKPNHTPLYLFPHPEAAILTPDLIKGIQTPIQLIVPDGSWRQAKKFNKREPLLKDIPVVKLPQGNLGQFFLRKKSHPEGVSTMEAIAYALGTIEGSEVQEQLLSVFKVMIERTLSTRGQKIENFLNGGAP